MIPKELQSMKPMTGKERLGANRESEYLGAEDIEPGTEPVLTIKALYNGMITLARGKERHDVISFAEEKIPGMINQVRPLVVNATNRKTLRKIYKNVTAETLVGKKIQLYLEHNVRDPSTGDKVDGIRIRPKVPDGTVYQAPKCAVCGKDIIGTGTLTAEYLAEASKKKYGQPMCVECGQKKKAEMEAEKQPAEPQKAGPVASEPETQSDLAAQLMAEAEE